MNGTTHMAVGALAGGLTFAVSFASRSFSINIQGYEVYPLVVTAAAAMGGLAPDVDIAHSKAGRFLRKFLHAGLVASTMFMLVMFFLPESVGIGVLDGAIGMGERVDRGVPIVLAAFCVLVMIIIEKSKHRGFTHTVPGLVLVSAPLMFMLLTGVLFVGADIAVSGQIGFVMGWLSHMLIDTFNRGGIPWLWPVTKKRFRVAKIATGSVEEGRFLVFSIVGFAMIYAFIVV